MTMMVFKSPGPEKIHGQMVQFEVVDEADVDARLADGWHLTAIDAGAAYQVQLDAQADAQRAAEEQEAAQALADDTKPPTREELEQMATKLGISFGPRVSDKKLRALVDAAAQPDTGA